MEFGRRDLRAGCASGINEEVGAEEVGEILQTERMVSSGRMVSSAFTVWQGVVRNTHTCPVQSIALLSS
jgi:hypothetical protein